MIRSTAARLLWVLVGFFLGVIPSVLLFVWIERGCALPRLSPDMPFNWLDLGDRSLAARMAVDTALFAVFGFFHSLLARTEVKKFLSGMIPEPAFRAFYVICTGLTVLFMIGLWQSTGIVVWALRLQPSLALGLSLALFWTLMVGSMSALSQFNFLEFLGFSQLYGIRAVAPPKLVTTGAYAWVRHPAYLLTFLAFVVTPVMTLDRLFIAGLTALYIAAVLPLEERKLVDLFGQSYVEYRARTPAVLPFFRVRS